MVGKNERHTAETQRHQERISERVADRSSERLSDHQSEQPLSRDSLDRQWRESGSHSGIDDVKIDWGMHSPSAPENERERNKARERKDNNQD
jgi:hypothetical protein